MDVALASEVIDAQFPHLTPLRLTCLGEGCDSTAFEVNGTWVFPKLPGVPAMAGPPEAIRFEAMARLLGALLSALHASPLEAASDAGVPHQQLDLGRHPRPAPLRRVSASECARRHDRRGPAVSRSAME